MPSLSHFSVILLLASCLLLARPAQADSGELQDRLAIDFKAAGDQAMQTVRYEQALEAYDRASEIEPAPILLFNRGRALQALKRYPEALAAITAFKEQAPPELAAKAGDINELLANLRRQVARIEIKCDVPDARVVLDGQLLGVTPLPTPRAVNAGRAHLSVTADGYLPFERDVVLPAGAEERIVVTLVHRKSEGRLTVTSVVGAIAFVDGVRLGSVPAEVTLPTGRHLIRIEHAGYLPSETRVEVAAAQHRVLRFPLERRGSLLGQWWVWTSAALVVATGVTVYALATTERSPTSGDIPPGRVASPLLSF